MADGTQEWTEFTLPTSPLLGPDTITEPTEEYSPPDLTVSVSTLSLTATLNVPINVLRYDNPSSLAGTLQLNNPALNTVETVSPATVEITGTVNAPTPRLRYTLGPVAITGTVNAPIPNIIPTPAEVTFAASVTGPAIALYDTPATLAGVITVNAPTIIVTQLVSTVAGVLTEGQAVPNPTGTPAEVSLTAGTNAPTPEARTTATTFNLSLTVNQPTVVGSPHRVGANMLQLGVYVWHDPRRGSMAPTIVRYIKDPITTGGCAQCGTFLYSSVRGRAIRGEVVKRGRSFDKDKGLREDKYVRCGRCGFINHLHRAINLPQDSSKAGWGLKYDEVEAGESDISYP